MFGRYRIEESFRSGGYADLFFAVSPDNQTVILRRLRPEFARDRARRERFQNGCETLRAFNHPNVIRQLDVGVAELPGVGPLPFHTMEYVNGPTLGDAIRRQDPIASYDRMGLMLCMANGLTHIHERGYLHLDFKPDNVIIGANTGDVKIVDFDLARPRRPHPQHVERLAGTPHYLSPEELNRHEVDERSDIFAFGVTSYELWTGHKPLEDAPTRELPAKYAHFHQHLRPPHALNPALPADVEKIILRCLQEDPAARYPAMAMVLRDLAAD